MAQPSESLLQMVAKKLNLSDEETKAFEELVLVNPDLLIAQYKASANVLAEAQDFERNGNMVVAENRYASAAKLALYENNPNSARKFLSKCIEIGATGNSTYKTAQTKFDRIAECISSYYKERYGTASS